MIKLFCLIFGICSHKWTDFKQIPIKGENLTCENEKFFMKENIFPSNYIFILKCEKCGNLKRFKTKNEK